ncbi:uncharacterized [Tachysurus ichikawai]
MMRCSACCGLSLIDRGLFSACHTATDDRLSSSVPTTEPAFLTCLHSDVLLLDAASTAHCHIEEGTGHNSLISFAVCVRVGSPVQILIQLHS